MNKTLKRFNAIGALMETLTDFPPWLMEDFYWLIESVYLEGIAQLKKHENFNCNG